MSPAPSIRSARTASELAESIRAFASAEVEGLDSLERTLQSSVRSAARLLVAVLSRVAEDLTPGEIPPGRVEVATLREMAVLRGADALLTGWVEEFGVGAGTLAAMAAAIRETSDASTPVEPPKGLAIRVEGISPAAWRTAVVDAMGNRLEPLERIRRALELTESELGELFGVSRQAVTQWRQKGIPATRADAVAHVLQAVDLLDRKLKSGRLPLVARRPAERLGGRTILEALTADPAGTHAILASAFDWSTAA